MDLIFRVLIYAASCSAIASAAPVSPQNDPYAKDQLTVAAQGGDQIEYDYSISGTGPQALAVEMLGYFQKATASGLVQKSENSASPEIGYQAGHFYISDARASEIPVAPPLEVLIHRAEAVWIIHYQNGKITLNPPSEDSLTLVRIMAAAGVPGISCPIGLCYSGKKVVCNAETNSDESIATADSATCWLTMDSD